MIAINLEGARICTVSLDKNRGASEEGRNNVTCSVLELGETH
jgi:hypothetical protein